MQVILLSDVKSLGKKGQIVKVADGYAQSFLFPRKLAVIATETSLNVKKQQDEDAKKLYEQQKEEAKQLKAKIEGIMLEFHSKSGKDGRMFGSISTKQVCEKMKEKHGITLDKKKFVDANPVNSLGVTKLKIELFKDVIATVNVHVLETK